MKVLKGLKVADDILITGRGTMKDEAVKNHNANLLKLLERCREKNLKLNREKLQLKCTETPFIGHILTPEGRKPDPTKAEAVLKSFCLRDRGTLGNEGQPILLKIGTQSRYVDLCNMPKF